MPGSSQVIRVCSWGGAGDGGRKERTHADCTDGTGERTEKDEEGKKEEAKRKRREDGKKEKEGEIKKKVEERGGAEKREKGTMVREGVEEGRGTVTEKEGGVEVGGGRWGEGVGGQPARLPRGRNEGFGGGVSGDGTLCLPATSFTKEERDKEGELGRK